MKRDESHAKKLTANASQVSFFICIGNTLEILQLDHLSGPMTIRKKKKQTPNLRKIGSLNRAEIKFETNE